MPVHRKLPPSVDVLPRRAVDADVGADALRAVWRVADAALHQEQTVERLRAALRTIEAELRGVVEV